MGEPSSSNLPGETDSHRRLPSPRRGRARRQEHSGDEENQRERSCSRVRQNTTLSALPEQPASLPSLSPRVRPLASSPPSAAPSSSPPSCPSSSPASSSASSSSSSAPSSSRCSSSPMQTRVLTPDGDGGNTAGALAGARRLAGRTETSKTSGDEKRDDEASRVHTLGERPKEQRRRARRRVGSKGDRRRGSSLRRGERRDSEEHPCTPPSPSFVSSSLPPAEGRRQAATPSSLLLASSPLSSCPLSLRPLRVSLLTSLLFVLGLGVLLFLAARSTLRNGARDPQRLVLPYCNKTRNLPLALVENSPASPPVLAAGSLACVPCPAHAVCLNGEMRCVPPYIRASTRLAALESLLASFGVRASFLRSFFVLSGVSRGEDAPSCVEDEAAKETAKRVTDAVVLFLRSKAGEVQCASFAPLVSQKSPSPASAPSCEEGVESGRSARHTGGFPEKSVFREREDTFARRPEKMLAETRGKEEIEEHSARSSLSGGTPRRSGTLSGERSARESRPSESATRWEIIQLAQVKDLLEDDNVYSYVFNHFLDEETAERDFSVRVEQTYSFQSLDLVAPTEKSAAARHEQTEALLPLFLREQRRSRGITYTYTYTGLHALRPWSCTLYIAVMYRLAPAVLALLLLLLLSLPLAFWLRRVYLRHKLREVLLSREQAEASELFTLQRNALAAAIFPGTSSKELSHLLLRSLVTLRTGRFLRWWLQRLARSAAEVDTLCHDLLVDKQIRLHTARIGEQNFWWAETESPPESAQPKHPSNRLSPPGASGASVAGSRDPDSQFSSAGPPHEGAVTGCGPQELDFQQSARPTLLEMCGSNGPADWCASSLRGDGMCGETDMFASGGKRTVDGCLGERARRSSSYLSACRLADSLHAETSLGQSGKSEMRRPTLGGSADAYWREQRGSYLQTAGDTLRQRASLLGGGIDQRLGVGLPRTEDSSSEPRTTSGLKALATLMGGDQRVSLDPGSGNVRRLQGNFVSSEGQESGTVSSRRSSVKERAARDYSHAAFFAMASRGAAEQTEGSLAGGRGRDDLGFKSGEVADNHMVKGDYTGTRPYDQMHLSSRERRRSERVRSSGLRRVDDDLEDHERGHSVLC